MKRSNKLLFILLAFAVIAFACGDWWKSAPKSNVHHQSVRWYRNDPQIQNKIPEEPECVRKFLARDDYTGPTIQVDFVDERGKRLSMESVYVGSLSSTMESSGSSFTLYGAQSLKTAYVDRPAKMREMRSGIRYMACKAGFLVVDGLVYTRPTIFTTPKLEQGTNQYRITVVLPSPPPQAKDMNDQSPKPFQLEGVAPKLTPDKDVLRISYTVDGRECLYPIYVMNGAPFKFGVDSLGGELRFVDPSNDMLVYGFRHSVKKPEIGVVETIRSRKYTLDRSSLNRSAAEKIWFFSMTQTEAPISVAIFEERATQANVLLDSGKYRIYAGELPKPGGFSDLLFSEIEVGDEPNVKLK